MKFNLLCAELGIKAEQTTAQKLELLKQWFQKNVSSDLEFSGDEQELFEQYKQATEFYLDEILPETTHDIEKPNQKLDGESVVSALAGIGFDRVFFAIKPSKVILDTRNLNGLSPLHLAALDGHIKTAQVLLAMGANTCILNNQKQYPIFSALVLPIIHDDKERQNKVDIFRLLKEKGTQPLNHRDDNGNTVLHQMAVHDFDVLVKETLATNPELASIKNNHSHYPIHTSILNNSAKSVNLLLEVKGSSTLADSNGWVALHYAARYATDEVIDLCCKYSENKDPLDIQGKTPLMLAAELGELSAMKALVAHGANPNFTDLQEFGVLHYAVKSGNLAAVRWLVENTNVDINAKDHLEQTPLQVSQTVFNESADMQLISSFLLEHGATTISTASCN